MVTAAPRPTQRRLWLLFFGEAAGGPWWTYLLAPGYRHVSALSWFADQQRWVHVNPTAKGLVIELWGESEVDGRLGQLAESSSLILRMPSRADRNATPILSSWCVGVAKALLAIRSRALSPRALARHLLSIGAEVVEMPDERPEAAPGRPEGESPARAGTGAVGS